ncbi:hypothetical protein [Cohnella thailandensis]|uniref:GGDEF domain-containing protein n=1 Tax=Cohnella thailandensis TaxID=557557 RepID=A0A841SXX4_9BACL|nr:hypothetical protein [Cohnella thailandensis]MBB6635028.1 hypothetical protein [Cohnella thailandensis]MBP1975748.1 hypothetical protein [Cohnella thailandensis]
MQIKVGIIGTEAFIGLVLRVIKSFPTFLPVAREAANEKEAVQAAEQLSPEVEALVLSGALSNRAVKLSASLSVPTFYVPLNGAGLYKALFSAFRAGKLEGGISVDSLTKAMVMRTLTDLGLERTKVFVYDGPAYASPEQVVAFHSRLAESGQCRVAFTGVDQAAEQLHDLSIPCEIIAPSDQDVIVILERALLSTESRRGKESQIVVGMINVDDFGKLAMRRTSEHEVQKLKLDIHRMVLNYVELLDGYLTALGGDEYLFFTTRGIFERETGGYKTIPLAKDAYTTYGLSLSVGIGFGTSANDAGTNARSALRKAKEAGGNACFIIREDATLIGPLEMADPVQAILSPTDAELIKKAEEAGMTSTYLSKLLQHMARFSKYEYKVHELAELLNITVRSAHRLLLQWIDGGLVDIAGYEKMPKGRPRQIYRFTFLMGKSL